MGEGASFPILSAFLSALATEGSNARRRRLDAEQAAIARKFQPQPSHAATMRRGRGGVSKIISPNVGGTA